MVGMLLVARINGLEDFDVDVHSRARQLHPYKMAVNIAEQLAYQLFSIDVYLGYAWKELEFHIVSPTYAPFIICTKPCRMELRSNKIHIPIARSRLDSVDLFGLQEEEKGLLYAIFDLCCEGPRIKEAEPYGKTLPRLFPILLL